MSFLDKMGKTFSDTVKSVTEKNHKMAKMNRFRNRIALAQEEKEKAYIAIGKYYYEREKELPDEDIADSFLKIDIADREIMAVVKEIEELRRAEREEAAKEEENFETKASREENEFDTEDDENIPW